MQTTFAGIMLLRRFSKRAQDNNQPFSRDAFYFYYSFIAT
jgi:hypothetical protein